MASNIRTGLDWYVLSKPHNKVSTSLERQERDSNIPLPVMFINRGNAAVMGTTKGYAVIFHAEHGKALQTLDHANRKHKVNLQVSSLIPEFSDKSWVTALVSPIDSFVNMYLFSPVRHTMKKPTTIGFSPLLRARLPIAPRSVYG